MRRQEDMRQDLRQGEAGASLRRDRAGNETMIEESTAVNYGLLNVFFFRSLFVSPAPVPQMPLKCPSSTPHVPLKYPSSTPNDAGVK